MVQVGLPEVEIRQGVAEGEEVELAAAAAGVVAEDQSVVLPQAETYTVVPAVVAPPEE